MRKLLIAVLAFVLMTSLVPATAQNDNNINYSANLDSINFAPNSIASGLRSTSYDPVLQLWRDSHVGSVSSMLDVGIVSPDVAKAIDFDSLFMTEEEMNAFEVLPDHQLPGYAHHSTINIDSDRDLKRYPGSGIEGDPYVIEGFHITSTRKNLIQIKDVSAWVEIRNNHLDNLDSTAAGILVSNSVNVKIINNNILSNGNGVLVQNSGTIEVRGNDMYYSTNIALNIQGTTNVKVIGNNMTENFDSMSLSDTTFAVVSDNIIYNNGGHGITLSNTHDSLISGNTIYDNQGDGIAVYDSNRNTFDSNNIYSNGPDGGVVLNRGLTLDGDKLTLNRGFSGSAIFIDPSFDNTITNNNLADNEGSGILSEYSDGTIIDGNTITGNTLTGVFLLDSDDNEITNNEITNNGDPSTVASFGLDGYRLVLARGFSGSAIFIDPSHGNLVEGNDLSGNTGNGVFLQDSTTTTINDNTINNNDLTGVSLENSDDNTITNNDLNGNGDGGAAIASNVATNAFEFKLMRGFSGSAIFIDPSKGNTVQGNSISQNAGVGVYLQLSDDNDVIDNDIFDNGAEGVFLEDSHANDIVGNVLSGNGVFDSNYIELFNMFNGDVRLFRGFSGSAIFIDPSVGNTVTGNTIYDNAGSGVFLLESDNTIIDDNDIFNNDGYGVELIDSDDNTISSNRIDDNGEASAGALELTRGFSGSAIFIDPSAGNHVVANNASGNALHALEVIASVGTVVDDNRFEFNGGYGTFFDDNSGDSIVTNNNFDANNNNATQAYDDGFNNQYGANYYVNQDHTDANYDGIADEPYVLDGNAGVVDDMASNIKNGLNFYTTSNTKTNPTKLNADSEGTPLTIVITLGDGYRALQVDPTDFTVNGTAHAVDATIDNILEFRLLFDRLVVNELVNQLLMEPPFFVTFEVNGRMNDGLLDLTAFAVVEINQVGEPLLNGSEMLVVGSMLALPLTRINFKKKEN